MYLLVQFVQLVHDDFVKRTLWYGLQHKGNEIPHYTEERDRRTFCRCIFMTELWENLSHLAVRVYSIHIDLTVLEENRCRRSVPRHVVAGLSQ